MDKGRNSVFIVDDDKLSISMFMQILSSEYAIYTS